MRKPMRRLYFWFKVGVALGLVVKVWDLDNLAPAKKLMRDEARWGKRVRSARTNPPVAISHPTHPTVLPAAPSLRIWIRRSPVRNSHPASEKRVVAKHDPPQNDQAVRSPVRRKACRNRAKNMERGNPNAL